MSTRYIVRLGSEEPIPVSITEHDHAYEIEIDGETTWVDSKGGPESATRSLLMHGLSFEVTTLRDRDAWMVHASGDAFSVSVTDELWARAEAASSQDGGGETVVSPMPGSVVKVLVKVDQIVEPGSPVIIVEAMKMQNEIASARGGRVVAVEVADGDVVELDAVLIVLEALETES